MVKSRSCHGVKSKKKIKLNLSRKIWLQKSCLTKCAMFNFGAHGFKVKSMSPKMKYCTFGLGHLLFQFTCFRLSNDCNINDKCRKDDADHVQTYA